MKKETTVNTFTGGLQTVYNPIMTPDNIMCNALNATIITRDGDEYILQNDFGNGRVETANLPSGYIPIGTAELGGIIYIASYNPLDGKGQIGSFPSPERNIFNDELNESVHSLSVSDFGILSSYPQNNPIPTPYIRLELSDKILSPGDKFQIIYNCNNIGSEKSINDYLSAYNSDVKDADSYPRYLKLNVIAIDTSGKITNLNNTLNWDNGYYLRYINNSNQLSSKDLNVDEYRDLVTSNYDVFQSRSKGKLGVLAQLECINNFEVSWVASKQSGSWNIYLFSNWSYENSYDNSKINLYGIKYLINESNDSYTIIYDYPSSTGGTNDVMQGDKEYYSPEYLDPTDINNTQTGSGIRRNDGTDNQFLITTPINLNGYEGEVTLDIYPMMPFGYLEYLKQTIKLDIDKLGSGQITLQEYKYYVYESVINLNWALSAYVEEGQKITGVTFEFYDLNKNNLDRIKTTYNSTENLSYDYLVHSIVIDNKSSYSGHFFESINRSDLGDSKIMIVKICVRYTNGNRYFYRILFNDEIFNEYFYKYSDYDNISLDEVVRNKLSFDVQNISKEVNTTSTLNKYNNGIYVETDKIPKMYLEQTQDQYKIDYEITNSINYDLIPNFTDFLKVNCNNINTSYSQSSDVSGELVQTTYKGATTKISDNDMKMSSQLSTFNNNLWDYNIKQVLSIPIKTDYSRDNKITISKKLVPLKIEYRTLYMYNTDSSDSKQALVLCNNTVSGLNNIIAEYTTSGWDNDSNKTINFNELSNISNAIYKILDNCDAVALNCMSFLYDENGGINNDEYAHIQFNREDNEQEVWYSYGKQNGLNNTTKDTIGYNARNSNHFSPFAVIFVTKDYNDKLVFYTFTYSSYGSTSNKIAQKIDRNKEASRGAEGYIDGLYYGRNLNVLTSKNEFIPTAYNVFLQTAPINDRKEISNTPIVGYNGKFVSETNGFNLRDLSTIQEQGLFNSSLNSIIKPIDDGSTRNAYLSSYIRYFQNIKDNIKVNLDISTDIQLLYNGNDIKCSNIKNLNYSTSKRYNKEILLSNDISLDNYVDSIFEVDQSVYTLLSDGVTISTEIFNKDSLYYKDTNQICSYMPLSTSLIQSPAIKIKIQLRDAGRYLQIGSISSAESTNRWTLKFSSEEEGLRLSDTIYVL